jgi:hypothetical protein
LNEKIWMSATIDHDRLKELIEAGEQFFNGDCRYHFMEREGSVKRAGKVKGIGIQFSINLERHLLITTMDSKDEAGVGDGPTLFSDYMYTIKYVQNWDDLLAFAKARLIEYLEKGDDDGV